MRKKQKGICTKPPVLFILDKREFSNMYISLALLIVFQTLQALIVLNVVLFSFDGITVIERG
jgi:hypothetical protein